MLCVTMNDIPGWEIQRVCGEVFGVTVRSRNAFSQLGAGFKSMVGGELGGMTRNVIDSRNEAMTRLFAEAQARGGNALVAMRFDTTELGGNWSEICAYGTAVVAIPVTEAARQTAIQLGYGQPGSGQPGAGQPGAGRPQQGWAGQGEPNQQQWQQPQGEPNQQQWQQPQGEPQPAQQQWQQPAQGWGTDQPER
ncbi:MAG TPA: YbjQ family protein [Jatrophihabitans sp.]|nr:YbjQ family protein [Jatrophihabitans sp.]